jgi:hypothetical protein
VSGQGDEWDLKGGPVLRRSRSFTAVSFGIIGSVWSKVGGIDTRTFRNIKRYDATLRVRVESLISKEFS